MTTLEALKAAKKLIERPENWCRNTYKNDKGAFCADGALLEVFVSTDTGYIKARSFLNKVVWDSFHGTSMIQFNDTHTHGEVLDLYDAAIELAEKLEA